METRQLVEGPFGSEFLAICNHCRVMTAWSRKTWKLFSNFCVFFCKNDPLVFTTSLIDVVVLKCRKIYPTWNWWNCALFTRQKKHNFSSRSNCCYWAIRAQNLPGPTPIIWLALFQILSKSVHFRQSCSLMRESRFLAHRVFAWFAWNTFKANKNNKWHKILMNAAVLC